MHRFLKAWLIFILASQAVVAQILPEPRSKLNHTQVMLEYEKVNGAQEYLVEVFSATGPVDLAKPLIEQRDSSTATMVSNLKFGEKYKWRYVALINGKKTEWKGPFGFEIKRNPLSNLYRVRMENNQLRNDSGLLCIDFSRTIIDRQGNPVLFVDNVDTGFRKGIAVNDLKLTKYGTLTYLGGQNGFETDLKDSILWMTPLKTEDPELTDLGEFYNHDLKRMDNGHYMVIGSDYVWKDLPSSYDISGVMYDRNGIKIADSLLQKNDTLHLNGGYTILIKNGVRSLLMNMSSLCEYDNRDSLVWSWHPEKYLKTEDIFVEGAALRWPIKRQDPHLNGFAIDAKNEFVYVSFRNLSRIVKVDKKTGDIVQSWGEKKPSGEAKAGNDFFRLQHYPNVLADGNIAVFDNEDADDNHGFSNVRIFSQGSEGNPDSKLTWSFECSFDSIPFRKSMRGGSVEQLSNGNFLVCMGAINRIFEITGGKQVVWNAVVEQKQDTTWIAQPLNRVHYTSSLYPCYFTFQTDKDSLGRNDRFFDLSIFNEGTENDSYTITISGSNLDTQYRNLTSETVLPGRSSRLKIPVRKPLRSSEKIVVQVRSNANTNLQRKIVLYAR